MAEVKVTFDDGAAYERYMGRWSRAVGEEFLRWLAPPPDAAWLDVGCGTGAFCDLIVEHTAPKSVVGVDPAPAQIKYASEQSIDATFKVADALSLPFEPGTFDIVVSALVLHFLPDRHKGLSEMKRVAKPGGIVAGYTWTRGEGVLDGAPYTPMFKAVQALGVEPTRSPTVPEAAPTGLKKTLTEAGFENIDIRVIEVTQGFRDFDDYWEAQTPSFAPVMQSVKALSDAKRAELKENLRKTLPTAADGSISYPARAVAFKTRA